MSEEQQQQSESKKQTPPATTEASATELDNSPENQDLKVKEVTETKEISPQDKSEATSETQPTSKDTSKEKSQTKLKPQPSSVGGFFSNWAFRGILIGLAILLLLAFLFVFLPHKSAQKVETPIVEEVETPIAEEVETPIVEELETPIVEELETPIVEELETPIAEELETPIAEELEIPIVEELEIPIAEELETPIVEELETPIAEELETPIVEIEESPELDGLKLVNIAIPKNLAISPEQSLIVGIQNQWAEIFNRYSSNNLIQSIKANLLNKELLVTFKDDWYQLDYDSKNELANEFMHRSAELAFQKLEIIDSEGTILARTPVIGNNMVILQP